MPPPLPFPQALVCPCCPSHLQGGVCFTDCLPIKLPRSCARAARFSMCRHARTASMGVPTQEHRALCVRTRAPACSNCTSLRGPSMGSPHTPVASAWAARHRSRLKRQRRPSSGARAQERRTSGGLIQGPFSGWPGGRSTVGQAGCAAISSGVLTIWWPQITSSRDSAALIV